MLPPVLYSTQRHVNGGAGADHKPPSVPLRSNATTVELPYSEACERGCRSGSQHPASPNHIPDSTRGCTIANEWCNMAESRYVSRYDCVLLSSPDLNGNRGTSGAQWQNEWCNIWQNEWCNMWQNQWCNMAEKVSARLQETAQRLHAASKARVTTGNAETRAHGIAREPLTHTRGVEHESH
jgi:hypothetical protein